MTVPSLSFFFRFQFFHLSVPAILPLGSDPSFFSNLFFVFTIAIVLVFLLARVFQSFLDASSHLYKSMCPFVEIKSMKPLPEIKSMKPLPPCYCLPSPYPSYCQHQHHFASTVSTAPSHPGFISTLRVTTHYGRRETPSLFFL